MTTLENDNFPTQEIVLPKGDYTYGFIDTLQPSDAEYWFAVYEESFRTLNEESPERQTMSIEEFTLAMQDPEVSKLGVRNENNELIGLTVYGPINKSEIFTWLSQPYFKKHYGEAYEEGRVQYFVTTLVRPELRSDGIMASMGQIVTDRLLNQSDETYVVFDCCEQNTFLPEALHGLATMTVKSPEDITALSEIGSQRFYSFGMRR